MKTSIRSIALVLVTGLSGCSTVSFSVTRQAMYPAKQEGCPIEWVNVPAQSLGIHPDWEWVGSVSWSQHGSAAMDEALKKRVEAEACKLGGEAVSLGTSSTNETFMGSGSATILMVLRKRNQPVKGDGVKQL